MSTSARRRCHHISGTVYYHLAGPDTSVLAEGASAASLSTPQLDVADPRAVRLTSMEQTVRDIHWTVGVLLTFLLYIIASVASWRLVETVRRSVGFAGSRERTIWLIEAIVLFALAVSTAINAPGLATETLRAIAMDDGWYALRGNAQGQLIATLIGAFAVAAIVSVYWSRSAALPASLALLASMLLITFIVIRAISLHAVDQLVFMRIAGVTISSIFEAAGIIVILMLVLWRTVMLRRRR